MARGLLITLPDVQIDAPGLPDLSLTPENLTGTVTSRPGVAGVTNAGTGLVVNAAGTMCWYTSEWQTLAQYSLTGYNGSVLAGQYGEAGSADGVGGAARFKNPQGISLSDDERTLYVADRSGNAVRRVDIATATVTTLPGAVTEPRATAAEPSGTYLFIAGLEKLTIHNLKTGARDEMQVLAMATGVGMVWDEDRARLYAPSSSTINPGYKNGIYEIDPFSKTYRVLAGQDAAGATDGTGAVAQFSDARGITLGLDGTLYVADGGNNRIRAVDIDTGAVTTLAGSAYGEQDGTGSAALFATPRGIGFDDANRRLIVQQANTHNLRIIT